MSFRNVSTLVMIERASGNVVWTLSSPPLAQQHDPRPLPDGNSLIFDNGTHRRDHPATFSRVIEVEPRTGAIVWEHTDPSLFEFFSPCISGAQRLAAPGLRRDEPVPPNPMLEVATRGSYPLKTYPWTAG